MKRIFKFIGVAIIIVVILAIILAIALAFFIDPNRLKPLIIENTKKYTGRELIIDGDLSWSFFPHLGVKMNHAKLNNPASFSQPTFAEINRAIINVKLLPLIHGQIKSNGIMIEGMKLFLIKNANGVTNWQDLQPNSSTKATHGSSSQSTMLAPAALGLAIDNVTISNGEVSWQNEQEKQYIDIRKLNVNATNINLSQPFPIKVDFEINGKNPDISGSMLLTSDVTLNLAQQVYAFNQFNLSSILNHHARKIDIRIKGDIQTDLAKQMVVIPHLIAQIANLTIAGTVNISDLSTRMYTVSHITIQPFNVKQWLQAIGQDNDSLQSLNNFSGNFDITAEKTLQSVKMQGDVKIDDVQASHVRLDNIAIHTQLDKGLLSLSPITAEFYQGQLVGQTNVNLNDSLTPIAMQMKLNNIDMQPLLTDLSPHSKFKLSGKGNVAFHVTTLASNGDAMIKNLNGEGQLNLANGALQGIDIPYHINQALAIVKNQPITRNDTNQTSFGEFKGSFIIKNGVISNDDLMINTPITDTNGNGEINLVEQQIHYQLLTKVKQNGDQEKNNLQHLYGVTIPISIKGNLTTPSIRLDTHTLMQEVAHEQIQDVKTRVQEKIEKKLMKIPGGAGGLLNDLLR